MSAWQDLVTASLIGTERSAVPGTGVPGLPGPDSTGPDTPAPADPAVQLLDRAALLTVARRGGTLIRPAGHAEPPPAAEPDPAPAVSPAAGRRLARMLGGEHPDLLAEWLTAAVTCDRRVPAHLLPALLDRARRVSPSDPELRRLSAEAGGSRAVEVTAASIAMAESGGNQFATGTVGERGYWQINTNHGSLSTYDPLGNAKAAVIISANGTNWHPWTTFTSGAYRGRC